MSYGLPISVQVSNFLFAIGFGFADAVLYYLIVFLRKIFSSKKRAVFVQDVVFGLITSVLCFVFMQVYCDGEVRIDLIIAAGFGFFIFVYSVGKVFTRISDKTAALVKKLFQIVFFPLILVIKTTKKTFVKIRKFFKKSKSRRLEKKVKSKAKKEKVNKKDRKKTKKKLIKCANGLEKK